MASPLKLSFLLLFPILTSFGANLTLQQTVVPYEPEVVNLFGVLYEKIYPGPPNYTSIENGDAPESVLILELSQPIQVGNPNTAKENPNQPEKDVLEIQLALDEHLPQPFNSTHFFVTGSLFHANTPHHHTKVVMNPTNIVYLPPLNPID